MKKILSLAMACLLIISLVVMTVVPVSAASEQNEIFAALEKEGAINATNKDAILTVLEQTDMLDLANKELVLDALVKENLITADDKAAVLKVLEDNAADGSVQDTVVGTPEQSELDEKAQETIISSLKEHVPAEILNKHLPAIENVLQQLEITKWQTEQVVECIVAADAAVEDYHDSLSELTVKEREAVMVQVNKAAKILKARFEVKPSDNPKHVGDVIAYVYKEDGTKLADVDFDVKKTNTTSDVNVEYVVLAVLLMAGAIATAAYAKKATAR